MLHGEMCRAALFGKDFHRHVAAAEMLASSLEENMDAVLSVLDLLFRQGACQATCVAVLGNVNVPHINTYPISEW